MKRISILMGFFCLCLLVLNAQEKINEISSNNTNTNQLSDNINEEELSLFNESDIASLAQSTPFNFGFIIRVILSLITVLVLLYVFIRILRRLNQNTYTRSNDIFSLLASIDLGSGKSLYLIKLCDKVYFFSASPHNMSLVKEITEKDELDEIDLLKSQTSILPRSFWKFFSPEQHVPSEKNPSSKLVSSQTTQSSEKNLFIWNSVFRKIKKQLRQLKHTDIS